MLCKTPAPLNSLNQIRQFPVIPCVHVNAPALMLYIEMVS